MGSQINSPSLREQATEADSQLRVSRMSHTNLLYHIVFATKERAPLITPALRPTLHEYLGGTVRSLRGTALEVGGVADHVHLLVVLPPTIAVSDFLSKLKANSSSWAKRATEQTLRVAEPVQSVHG